MGSLVIVRANRTSCAGGSSGGVGVVTLRTGLAGGSGGLISVVAFWAELTAIGGVSSFVQTWSARHADPVIDSGSGEGGGDASVEAPPRSVAVNNRAGCSKSIHVAVSSYSWRSSAIICCCDIPQPRTHTDISTNKILVTNLYENFGKIQIFIVI